MSHIDELILELCPDGVEFKALGGLVEYEQPGKYLVSSTEYDDSYETPVLTAGQTFLLGYTDEIRGIYPASRTSPVVIFDDFTTAFKWVDFPFKAKSSAMKILKPKPGGAAILRYVFFAMQTTRYSPQDHARQWISTYSNFAIPVPPLEVQREIVSILDKFTALEAELEAELEARKQQYEHYRDIELTFDASVPRVPLGDIATVGTGSHDTKDATDDGKYVFYARGRDPLRLDTFDFDEQAIITAGDGVGVGKVFHFASGKYALHQRAYRVVPGKRVDVRYLYHFLVHDFSRYLERTSVHASVTSLRRPMFLKYLIPLPSVQTQREIADKLDTFDALTTDLSYGLPAELAARRKQYEYYRDRLLTFKELEVQS